jgi:DNA-binding XRE family transcriptional regulator
LPDKKISANYLRIPASSKIVKLFVGIIIKILGEHMYSKRIKEQRKAKGLTQIELAKISGVAQATISAYESGGNSPTTEAQTAAIKQLLGSVISVDT